MALPHDSKWCGPPAGGGRPHREDLEKEHSGTKFFLNVDHVKNRRRETRLPYEKHVPQRNSSRLVQRGQNLCHRPLELHALPARRRQALKFTVRELSPPWPPFRIRSLTQTHTWTTWRSLRGAVREKGQREGEESRLGGRGSLSAPEGSHRLPGFCPRLAAST